MAVHTISRKLVDTLTRMTRDNETLAAALVVVDRFLGDSCDVDDEFGDEMMEIRCQLDTLKFKQARRLNELDAHVRSKLADQLKGNSEN